MMRFRSQTWKQDESYASEELSIEPIPVDPKLTHSGNKKLSAATLEDWKRKAEEESSILNDLTLKSKFLRGNEKQGEEHPSFFASEFVDNGELDRDLADPLFELVGLFERELPVMLPREFASVDPLSVRMEDLVCQLKLKRSI